MKNIADLLLYKILNRKRGESRMAQITSAVQNGQNVYAYDGGHTLWVRQGKLIGFTSATVSVQTSSSTICECDVNNHIVTTHQA